jgi:hypothetical protein
MDLSPTPIWTTWTAGGPFLGDTRANARVMVETDWQLVLKESSQHRGRGTFWRDDPETLTEFALSTSWVIDSRLRRGDRSFQRIRNGEWTYWGGDPASAPVADPPAGVTRAELAEYLADASDALFLSDPTLRELPAYDGIHDFPDISGVTLAQEEAIGRLAQANVMVGYPDGNFKPTVIPTAENISDAIARLQDYMTGTTSSESGRAAVELPNVATVAWDRSVDTDAAECTINISNTWMKGNTSDQFDLTELGFPGYFTPGRGDSPDAVARWPNHASHPWAGLLMPNAIVRTYEGFGGTDLTVRDALTAGYLRQTGTWMIDRITISTDGTISIQARDMARLLIEQFLRPPIVPEGVYPLRYMRYATMETAELRTGNYTDYAEIIYDLLLWSGFLYDVFPQEQLPDLGGGPPPEEGTPGWAQVHGVIETTGAYADEGLPDELFDNRPVIDAITEIRGIVGYLFWVDEAGGAHFQSPNWFMAGNFDEDLVHVEFVPEIDEKVQLTGYTTTLSSENLRTEIVIASEAIPPVPPYGSSAAAYAAYNDAEGRATYYTPPESEALAHGMVLPAFWSNGAFNDPDERLTMAQLIAMHIFYRSRQSSVSMVGNPCIQVNDQVRIYERVSSETYLHYVRGISSSMDNDTGVYTMQLTTHWLGDGDDWPGDDYTGVITGLRKDP